VKAGIAFVAVGLTAPLPAGAQDWSYVRPIVADLNARLLAGPTATRVLTDWCARHHMAKPARIHAERVEGAAVEATPEQRARLQVGVDEPVAYRRVRLMCGAHLLSEAENWYVPARLTPAMRALLADSDTPFGSVIAPLRPKRRNLEVVQLWGEGPIPRDLLRHRALVESGEGLPLAEVVETYTAGVLEFSR
jgi:chorismate-pyruvate lyase